MLIGCVLANEMNLGRHIATSIAPVLFDSSRTQLLQLREAADEEYSNTENDNYAR